MPTAPSPVRVIPRTSHMFAQRNAKPLPAVLRAPVTPMRERGMNYGSSGFASAGGGALYGDFRGAWGEINMDLRNALPQMRARSRQQYRDNEYAQAYVRAMLNNVFGNEGIHFQMKVRDPVTVVNGVKIGGNLDEYANKAIEEARARFERKECYTVSKDLSRGDAHKLYATCACVDGEAFIRKVRGADNPFQYATQLIPPELIDTNHNEATLPGGGRIVMGIEFDAWNARVAYHVKKNVALGMNQPSAWGVGYRGETERVPAEDVIHLFKKEFANQVRGIPWLQPAMPKLHMLAAYEEAAIVNARVGATKMGFFRKTLPDGFMTAMENLGVDDIEEKYPGVMAAFGAGALVDNPQPAEWVELPQGVEPVPWTPNYPEAQFDPFVKACLRGIAAAMGISYATLSNDLSQNSFSSSRVGLNEEREQWKMLQTWFIENFAQPEFEGWLFMALATQQVALPPAKIDKFNSPVWSGRRWPQVNPLQDAMAIEKMLQLRLTTHSLESRTLGRDFGELMIEAKQDDDLMTEAGLSAGDDTPMGAANTGAPAQDLEGDGTGA